MKMKSENEFHYSWMNNDISLEISDCFYKANTVRSLLISHLLQQHYKALRLVWREAFFSHCWHSLYYFQNISGPVLPSLFLLFSLWLRANRLTIGCVHWNANRFNTLASSSPSLGLPQWPHQSSQHPLSPPQFPGGKLHLFKRLAAI